MTLIKQLYEDTHLMIVRKSGFLQPSISSPASISLFFVHNSRTILWESYHRTILSALEAPKFVRRWTESRDQNYLVTDESYWWFRNLVFTMKNLQLNNSVLLPDKTLGLKLVEILGRFV